MDKLKRYYPWLILISALIVSITGSYYSIYGIGRIFAGHQTGAVVMAFGLEFGNIIAASTLKIFWNDLPKTLRYYLCSAVVVLSVVTSIGIYGYLSDGYQITANKDKVIQSRIEVEKKKKQRFEAQLTDFKKEKEEVDASISTLRKSLSTDNQYQYTDKRGNVLTQIQSASKKGVQNELSTSTSRANELSRRIDNLHDSISVYEIKIIEIEATNDVAAELGPLKYISSLTGKSMDEVVNWFLMLLMLVFQPLAISLILAALFAFGKKPDEIIPEPIISSEPIIEPKVKKTRKPREKKVEELMEYPKTFDIEIEGLTPGETFVNEVIEKPKRKKRKIVDTVLPAEVAQNISEGLSKKKD